MNLVEYLERQKTINQRQFDRKVEFLRNSWEINEKYEQQIAALSKARKKELDEIRDAYRKAQYDDELLKSETRIAWEKAKAEEDANV